MRTGDELEGLADQFNRMTAQLRESYAGLERKVDERTRERDSPDRCARGRLDPLGEQLGQFADATLTSGIVWWLASLFVSILPAFVGTLLGARSPALQGAKWKR